MDEIGVVVGVRCEVEKENRFFSEMKLVKGMGLSMRRSYTL